MGPQYMLQCGGFLADRLCVVVYCYYCSYYIFIFLTYHVRQCVTKSYYASVKVRPRGLTFTVHYCFHHDAHLNTLKVSKPAERGKIEMR